MRELVFDSMVQVYKAFMKGFDIHPRHIILFCTLHPFRLIVEVCHADYVVRPHPLLLRVDLASLTNIVHHNSQCYKTQLREHAMQIK